MLDTDASALFSDCGRYRYWLRRPLGMLGRPIIFVCFNPSIASAEVDDPSVRRMVGFAIAHEGAQLIVVNAMTAIATNPDDLATMDDPIGPMADEAIETAARLCVATGGLMIAAWGVPKGKKRTREIAERRFRHIRRMGLALHYLRLTASGYPEHPLYLPAALRATPWEPTP
jgi:hypothetical protein